MSDDAAIDRLRRIAAAIDRQHPDREWFAAALAEYSAGARHGLTLGDAFGFRLGPGETPWWECEARARRDALIRSIATRHFPSLRGRPRATALMDALQAYEAADWRRHRGNLSPPAVLADLQRDLFALLKIGEPLSYGTIRRVLAHETPSFGEPAGAAILQTDPSEESDASREAKKSA